MSTSATPMRDQVTGQIVHQINNQRLANETIRLAIQDERFKSALSEIENVRNFVGSPESILGNPNTKHGEIAEVVEVGVRRAKDALAGNDMSATFEGVSRTGPTDYIVNGLDIQSKFINGVNNNLDHVIGHMKKYPGYGIHDSHYHIPKDAYDTVQSVVNGDNISNLNANTVNRIREKVGEIEQLTGQSFNVVVKPGISTYAEVQQGNIHKTIEKHNESIKNQNESSKQSIINDNKPSISEGLQATGIAASVGGAISFTSILFKKSKEGKKFYRGDYTLDDWKEVGIDTAKGAALGGVSGAAIYGLTNYASLSAPFAGAVVSATKGVTSLLNDYRDGKLVADEVMELGAIICAESAIVGLATAIGQTIIPIPILGALIGSVAGTMLTQFIKGKPGLTAHKLNKNINDYLSKLDEKYRDLVKKIQQEFQRLGDLTSAAFDLEINKRLVTSSVNLAREYGVDDDKIIKTTDELDGYIHSRF
jgi:hypothetical protein